MSRPIEDICPLSPAQEGQLFHALLEPGADIFLEQLHFRVGASVDVDALERSWRVVLARHQSLRGAPLWQGRDRPLWVVQREVAAPFERVDWRGSDEATRLSTFLEADRRRGFALDQPPLLRLTLARLHTGYRLCLTYHHLALDGWSLGIVLREVLASYEAERRGRRASLPPAPPLRSYFAWLKQRPAGAGEQHFRRLLADLDTATPVPLAAEPTSAHRTDFHGDGAETRWLSAEASAALASLARERRVTLGGVLHAAWAVLLARYGGSDEVVFGTVLSGRPPELAGIEGLVGNFINVLPLRLGVGRRQSSDELFRALQLQLAELRQHEHMPLSLVQRLAGVTPLFETVVVVENYPLARMLESLGRALEVSDVQGVERSDVPLSLYAVPGTSLELRLAYHRRRLSADAARQLLDHLEHVLAAMVERPDAPTRALPLLSAGDRARVLSALRGPVAPIREEGAHQLVQAQAQRTPDAVAVQLGDTGWTYDQLEQRATRLARALAAMGATTETRVAVCLERSPDLVAALLAVWKAGAAYVPIDPLYPAERIALVLEDARVAVVLTQRSLLGALPAHAAAVLCVDDEREWGSAALPARVRADQLAYAIYTSGSTGRPKGVQISHRSLTNLLAAMRARPGLRAHDVLLAVTTLSFDIAGLELWLPLTVGAKVVIASREVASDGERLAAELARVGATVLQATPTTWRLLLAAPWKTRVEVLCGGEALPRELAEQLLKRGRVWNLFGPTETTIWSTVEEVAAGEGRVSIGRAIDNTTALLLDDDLELVPPGAPGRLYLGGVGVMRGYLGRPDLTAERALPDPFGEPGERIYDTGDRARLLPDGRLEFLGRVDHQLKVRGFRIEPGEIEAVLARHSAVRENVVVGLDDGAGGVQLVAYVAADPPPSQASLHEHVARSLPPHLIPSRIVVLPSLPHTPNGKIDRRALPAPQAERRDTPAALGERERLLEQLFGDVLGVGAVGLDDDFFALGGHSLSATRLASRVRDAFRVELPLRAIFEGRTVAALLRAIDAHTDAAASLLPAIVPAAGARRLSAAQLRMWLLQQLDPEGSAYNLPVAVRIRGPLELDRLNEALAAVVARHETLSERFEEHDGRPELLDGGPAPRLTEEDLGALAPAALEAELRRRMLAEARRPFVLSRGPLLRGVLLRRGPDDAVLLLTMHHIVSDGVSMGLLVRELTGAYAAIAGGATPSLPTLPVQYSDYAYWQRTALGPVWEADLAYWRERLAGAARLEVPADLPRVERVGASGAELRVTIAASTRSAIAQLARTEGVTTFMILLAVLDLLLYRRSGQDDVVVGSPIANRSRPEIDGLIGCFVNTLALRVDLSGDPSFRELLRRVRETTLGAYAHQHLPFEQLLEHLPLEREVHRNPLFEVLINAAQADPELLRAPGLELELLDQPEPDARFPLTLYVDERADGLELRLAYQTQLFSAENAALLLRQLCGLVDQVVREPARQLSAFDLLGDADRALLADPTSELERPRFASVPQRFFALAAEHGDAPALRQHERTLSYAQLAAGVRGVARALALAGIGRGDVVALSGPRSRGMITAMMGVLASGGVLLTLDPALPVARRRLMLTEAKARLVLHLGQDGEAFVPSGVRELFADGDELFPDSAEDPPLPAEGPAYLFFTSGTTGTPKAVLGCHEGLAHFLAWERDRFAVGPGDRCGQLTGLSFDVVLRDVFLPLSSGATLCLPPDPEDRGAAQVLPWLAAERVSVLHTVPTLAASWLAEVERHPLPALRLVLFAGELLQSSLLLRWRASFPGPTRIVNLYGPTETTLAKCCFDVPDPPSPGAQPVGTPLPQTQVLVLGPTGTRCGIGEPGEVVIRTPFRSLGYLNARPDEPPRFVPNPWRADAADLLYRTGDRGRVRLDGKLELIGRIDHQVKIRGMRVEPGEIEAVLSRHPGVRSAVVVARKEGGGSLAAYVVGNERSPDVEGLHDYLRAELPDYMVPASIMALERLPLTANGKVDRAALPAPTVRTRSARQAPSGALEQAVAAIWGEVLGRHDLGLDDDFFALGGHSLLASQALARVRAVFQVDLPLRRIFEHPTLGAFAASVAAALQDARGASLPPLRRVEHEGAAPLSFPQQRLWYLDQLEPGSAVYNMASGLRVEGALDLQALERAIQLLIERHESLRTVIVTRDGHPAQAMKPRPLPLRFEDLSATPAPQREALALRRAQAEGARPFVLASGPLVRFHVLRLDEADHVVLVTMHHIVSDAWSMSVLFRELIAAYEAARTGTAPVLGALPCRYTDFAAWQRETIAGERLEALLAYWRDALADAPTLLDLPTRGPRPTVQSHRGARQAIELSPALTDALRGVSRVAGCTLSMTMLALFQSLLHRYSGQRELLVGLPVANRSHVECEGVVGCFVNTVVIRGDFAEVPTFLELLAQVRERVLGALAHQALPFERLVEELRPDRSLDRTPIVQAVFVMQNVPTPPVHSVGLRCTPLEPPDDLAKFDLTLSVAERDGGISGFLEYATDLFDAAAVARMRDDLLTLSEALASRPDTRVGDVSLVRAAPIAQRDASVAPPQGTLIDRFVAQAAARPAAPAVTCGETTLTYAELDRRANRLARRLVAAGVGREVKVGLLLERSVELVVAIVGILKANAAYVPLDPVYPDERIALMVADAAAAVVVSERALAGRVPGGAHTILVDDQSLDDENAAPVAADSDADSLAYLLYTSGSTGVPKGVQVTHGNVLRLFDATAAWFGFDHADVWTLFHSYAFDFSVWELWGALLYGGRVVVVPYWVSRSPEEMYDLLQREGVTVLNQTPSAFRQLIRIDEERPGAALALRFVIFGGEALELASLRPWFERHGDDRPTLVNMYGITETTVHVTYRPLRRQDAEAGRGSMIGRPIPDLDLYLLDGRMQPVPPGVVGEIYVGGAGVARGYWNRPELDRQRFLDNPFGCGRLYRSGDLGRQHEDGDLEYLGRIDQQVKIRGFRIELGDIEAQLARDPAVREAAVVVREDRPGDKQLVAYVVAGQAGASPSAALRERMRERLPEYMVPSAVVWMEKLPLTANGKLDRRALPAPEREHVRGEEAAPRTAEERILLAVWQEVLGQEEIGAEDNFFEMGGDSILSIQVVARAAKAGLRVTPKQVVQHATVRALAAVAERGAVARSEEQRTGEVPLLPIQARFLAQELPEWKHYNQAVLLEVVGELDEGLLGRAWTAVLARHDAFSLRCEKRAGTWEQRYGERALAVEVERYEVGEPWAEKLEAAATKVQAGLDPQQGRWLRVALLTGGGRKRVLIAIHHLVVDGVSWRVLLDEVERAYDQLSRGEAVELGPETTSLGGWARALAQYARGEEASGELGYWREVAGRAALALPAELDGQNLEQSAAGVELELGEAETEALLTAVPAAYGAHVDEALLSGLLDAMSETTGRGSGRIELEGHGREELVPGMDLSGTVGWLTSLYPVYLERATGPAAERLAAVKEQLRAVPHKGMGYGLLRHLRGDEVLRAATPAQVSFNYLGQFDRVLSDARLKLAPEGPGQSRSPTGKRTHVLGLDARVEHGKLRAHFSFSQALHRRATIETLARRFLAALSELARAAIDRKLPEAPGPSPTPHEPNHADRMQLSFGEERLYAIHHRAPGSPLLNLPKAYRIEGAVDRTVLDRSLTEICRRHEVLRCNYHASGGRLTRSIASLRSPLEWIDLGDRPDAMNEALARAQQFADHAFDLAQEALFRVLALRLSPNEHLIVVNVHHIVWDGWSWGPFLRELAVLYEAFSAGQRSPLPELAFQYPDYAAWQRSWLRGDAWEAQANHWRRHLGDGAPLHLPLDHARPEVASEQATEVKVEIPSSLGRALIAHCHRSQTTMFTTLYAAFGALLHLWSREERVVIGFPVFSRSERTTPMIGYFLNHLACCLDFHAQPTIDEVLRRTSRAVFDAYAHQDVPVSTLTDIPELYEKLYRVRFNFTNFPREHSDSPSPIQLHPVRLSTGRSGFDLSLYIDQQGDQLAVSARYKSALFDSGTIVRLLVRYRALLERMVAQPQARLTDLGSELGLESAR
jgi:amino acid adenylation domain-containing protein/non-ribosomal peptide synthase protein (TIGR01720 family)